MYRLIYFFGPDGTGKTTQAELVSSWLRRRGHRVWRTSIKYHHMLSYVVLKLLVSGDLTKRSLCYYGFVDPLAKKIRIPWKLLELTSLIFAIVYRVMIPMLLGYIIVCDRYVLDSLVTLSYFLKDTKLLHGRIFRLMVKFLPENVLLFHLDAETETLLRRKKEEPLSTGIVTYYRRSYSILVKQLRKLGKNVIRIDTTDKSIRDVHRIVLDYMNM